MLGAFHAPARERRPIVVAVKMEEAVDEITGQFELPGGSKSGGLRDGFGETQVDLTVKSARVRRGLLELGMIEGNDVGAALMLEKLLV